MTLGVIVDDRLGVMTRVGRPVLGVMTRVGRPGTGPCVLERLVAWRELVCADGAGDG
jgi:hypothetical protein